MVSADQGIFFLLKKKKQKTKNSGQGILILLRNIAFPAKIDSTPFNLKWLFQVKRMTVNPQSLFQKACIYYTGIKYPNVKPHAEATEMNKKCSCKEPTHLEKKSPYSYSIDNMDKVLQKLGAGVGTDVPYCKWQHCCILIPEQGKYLLILGTISFTEAKYL